MIDLLFRGRRLVFESALSLEEVTARLEREVTSPVWTMYDKRTQLFEGTFAEGRFRMFRLVRGRNSFRPMITGELSPAPTGSRIDVELRLHPAVVVFAVVLALIGVVLTAFAVSEFRATGEGSPQLFATLFMAVGFSTLLVAPGVEVTKSTGLLAKMFESQPVRAAELPLAPSGKAPR